jgi:hypothetical protein
MGSERKPLYQHLGRGKFRSIILEVDLLPISISILSANSSYPVVHLYRDVEHDLNEPLGMNYLQNMYGNDWVKVDLDLGNHEQILSDLDKVYLNTFLRKISRMILAGNIRPKLRGGIMKTKMSSIVPQHSNMLRNATINCETTFQNK